LRQMKNKEFLVNMSEERALLLGLVDIIFAFVYDHLATMGLELFLLSIII
jgi:hypothetical protein